MESFIDARNGSDKVSITIQYMWRTRWRSIGYRNVVYTKGECVCDVGMCLYDGGVWFVYEGGMWCIR